MESGVKVGLGRLRGERMSEIAVGVAVAIGLVALLGWVTGVHKLSSLGLHSRPMHAGTALCIISLAAGITAVRSDRPRLGRTLGVLVLVYGVLTMLDYVTGANELPGRATFAAGFSWSVLGTALAVSPTRSGSGLVADVAAAVTSMIAVVGLLGRGFDVPNLDGAASTWLAPMAVPTALALLMLSFAVLELRPGHGVANLMRATGPGGHVARWMLPAMVVVPVVFSVIVLLGVRDDWYGTEESLALLTTALIVAGFGSVVFIAARLEGSDADRRATERRQIAILDAALDALITIDGDGKIIDFNRSAERMFGHRATEIAGHDLEELIVPERHRDRGREALGRAVDAGRNGGRLFELAIARADGTIFRAEAAVDRLPAGGSAAFVMSFRDVSSRAAREETVRRLASIIEASTDAVAWVTADGLIRDWNPAAEKMYGVKARDAMGRNLGEIVLAPDEKPVTVNWQKAILHGQNYEGEAWHQRANGERFPVEFRVVTGSDAAGMPGASLVVRDVAVRVRAEREMARLAAVVESSQDAIFTVGDDGVILTWNRAAEEIYGYNAAEMIGRPISKLSVANDPSQSAALMNALRRGENLARESVARRKDGTEVEVMYSAFPILHGADELGAGFIVRDVTERRHLEHHLRQVEKMEAVGQLAGGIAHDFNNLLTVISGYGSIARRRIGAGPGAHELEEIEAASGRGVQLTRQLLAFARRQVLDPRPTDVGRVVEEIMPMLGRLIGEDVQIAVATADRLPMIEADRGQLEQVIINLAVNARDAMLHGGTMTIETSARGGEVKLKVTDTGHGMDQVTVDRIFEPFYTTKGVGEGTGLGLATVHGVVTGLGGRIHVSSEPGLGTTFELSFPSVAGDAAAVVDSDDGGVPEIVEQTPGGTETILICEDEEPVRRLIVRMLSAEGYRTIVAATPEEAISIAAEGGQIHALVSDVVMPGMRGPDLLERLRETRPELPTLFLSGYTAQALEARGGLPPDTDFLEKPFDRAGLLRALRQLLDTTALTSPAG